MKRIWVGCAALVLAAGLAYAGGQAETGRESAVELVEQGSFVASTYLDLESILDDYAFPYEAGDDEVLSVYLDVEKPLCAEWGSSTMLQVSLISAGEEHFREAPLHYVVFPYSAALFDDSELEAALERSLGALLSQKASRQTIWMFLRRDRELVEITAAGQIRGLLERAERQRGSGSGEEALLGLINAERDLRAALEAGRRLADERPTKYLWILDKPVAGSEGELEELSSTIAGFGRSDTEISYLGHGPEFRPQTVNTLMKRFGGNSYYVTDAADLADTIERDFAYYRRPAISDLRIAVHSLGALPAQQPVREYTQVTMGPDEHHLFLVPFNVPARLSYAKSRLGVLGEYEADAVREELDRTDSYPLAYVTVSYYDHGRERMVYGHEEARVRYTTDYEAAMEGQNAHVARNLTILDTYRLFQEVSFQLQSGNYIDPLMSLNDQAGRLARLNAAEADELVAEDIELIEQYKAIIVENRDNPLRGIKTWSEIRRRAY
mgnify:FL=1